MQSAEATYSRGSRLLASSELVTCNSILLYDSPDNEREEHGVADISDGVLLQHVPHLSNQRPDNKSLDLV